MKGSQRSRVDGLYLAGRHLCRAPFGLALLSAALFASGCGDYKPPTFGELIGTEEKEDEAKKPQAPVATTPPTTESPISPGSVPVGQPAPDVDPAPIQLQPAVTRTPEQIIADLEQREYRITADSELKLLADSLGDRTDLVTKLDLSGSKVTPEGMQILASFPNLADLSLENMSLTSDGWPPLAKLGQLERLSLHRTSIDDQGLSHIRGLTKLKDLNLSRCSEVTDEGHYHLEPLVNLEVRDISSNAKIRGAGLAHVRKKGGLGSLRELIANNTQFGVQGMDAIVGLKSLEVLEIGSTSLNNLGMGAFRKCTGIKRLVMGRNQAVTDAGVAELSRLKQLEYLRVPGLALVTDEGLLNQIKGAKKLEYLDVEGTRVTRRGAQKLKQLIPKVTIKLSNTETIE